MSSRPTGNHVITKIISIKCKLISLIFGKNHRYFWHQSFNLLCPLFAIISCGRLFTLGFLIFKYPSFVLFNFYFVLFLCFISVEACIFLHLILFCIFNNAKCCTICRKLCSFHQYDTVMQFLLQ